MMFSTLYNSFFLSHSSPPKPLLFSSEALQLFLRLASPVKTCGKVENDEDKSGNDEAKGVLRRRGVTEGDGR